MHDTELWSSSTIIHDDDDDSDEINQRAKEDFCSSMYKVEMYICVFID